MKYPLTLTIILLTLTFLPHPSHSATVTLPVPQQTIARVSLSIQKLEELLKYFNTRNESKWDIYKRVELTKVYLNDLSNALSQYNNVIAGDGNSANGNKNVVIGNYNNINGSNNWVFISKFTGNINGDLLISEWRIELQKSKLIMINPRLAISYIDEDRNKQIKKKYRSRNRQLCQWDKWAKPDNQKSSQHWERYNGYGEWKSTQTTSQKNLRNQYEKVVDNSTSSNWGSGLWQRATDRSGWTSGWNWGK